MGKKRLTKGEKVGQKWAAFLCYNMAYGNGFNIKSRFPDRERAYEDVRALESEILQEGHSLPENERVYVTAYQDAFICLETNVQRAQGEVQRFSRSIELLRSRLELIRITETFERGLIDITCDLADQDIKPRDKSKKLTKHFMSLKKENDKLLSQFGARVYQDPQKAHVIRTFRDKIYYSMHWVLGFHHLVRMMSDTYQVPEFMELFSLKEPIEQCKAEYIDYSIYYFETLKMLRDNGIPESIIEALDVFYVLDNLPEFDQKTLDDISRYLEPITNISVAGRGLMSMILHAGETE